MNLIRKYNENYSQLSSTNRRLSTNRCLSTSRSAIRDRFRKAIINIEKSILFLKSALLFKSTPLLLSTNNRHFARLQLESSSIISKNRRFEK